MSVVAIVAALDAAGSIAATVSALRTITDIDRIVVVDDGSKDATALLARQAGAEVLHLPVNVGKGGAVAAARSAAPDAEIYLLIDADLGSTADLARALIEPVLAGDADMTIAVLPSAGGRGGFGIVRDMAAAGIRRACGFEPRAPLSGQRAVRGELLRELHLAERFGLETGLTIDAVRAGHRVVEIELAMDHRHTGRSLAGFRHRARQGVDILAALWSRLTTERQRMAAVMLTAAIAAAAMLWSAPRAEPTGVPAAGPGPTRVVLFGMPGLDWDDVGTGRLPELNALLDRGAVAAMSVRTIGGRPTTGEAYASLGAGTRVRAGLEAGLAFDRDEQVEGGPAIEALARRTGRQPRGNVVVIGAPRVVRQSANRHLSSQVGALGAALRAAGKRVAAVGNADALDPATDYGGTMRPTAIAVMGADGEVDAGSVGRHLLRPDLRAPYGVRADGDTVVAAVLRALATADLVVVDPGDLDRAAAFSLVSTPEVAVATRAKALRDTDRLLGAVIDTIDEQTLVMVVSPTPPRREWHLTPVVLVGPGIERGWLHSPSTRRPGVVTLTDLAPTILERLGVEPAAGMIGHAFRYRSGDHDLGQLRRLDRDAAYREEIYLPITIWYIVLQALVYLIAIAAFTRFGGAGRGGPLLRWTVLAIAAHPLGTFVLRAIPETARLGWGGIALLVAIDIAIAGLAQRARRRPLSPLSWILGATIALLLLDVATGARLQSSSILGYSLHTAARFTGFGNTAFATLAATTVLVGALHVHHAPRRREALVSVAMLFGLVVLADGAPTLGSDVGGILTLVPVFGLTLLVLSGRRLSWRMVVLAGAVTMVAVAGAAAIDLLRPPEVRTHLGRLVGETRTEGLEPFVTTLARKLTTNFRTYRSPWTWAVVVISVYLLAVLVGARGWARLLPAGSAVRAGIIGALAAGLLGYATNDSGIVVTALVFVYLGPFLTMLALEDERRQPVMLE